MKKMLALLLAAMLCVGLVACGGGEPAQEQQMVADAVKELIQSETFADWQSLYKEFSGEESGTPEVTNVTHYQIDDFEGKEMDCYLVNISAGIAYWHDEAAEMGAMEENLYLYIDGDSNDTIDHITTDAVNFDGDFSTDEGKAKYLLWQYWNFQNGMADGDFINQSETVTELSKGDLKMINKLLAE